MIKKWNDFKLIKESNTFRDNKKGMSLYDMMEHTNSFRDSVACDLIHIITNVRGISEKAFTAWDDVSNEVEDFYNNKKEEIDFLVDIFETNGWRSNYLAEKIYNEHFNSSNINEAKDFENVSKPKELTSKMDGVSLGKAKNGKFFVYTHRARSKYYDTPESIPQKDIDFIKTTG